MTVAMVLAMAAMFSGCASMDRLGIPFTADKAKVGIRLILNREGYSEAMTDEEVSQIVDWVDSDWTQNQERQAFLDGIAERKENEASILAIAGKYFPGGEWNLPSKADKIALAADEWGKINWISENYSGAVHDFDMSASVESDRVRFSFPSYDWAEGSSGSTAVDAVACFFVRNGEQWEGGKFEFIRPGGQATKSLKNIKEGYGGIETPDDGAKVAFAWVSLDGKKRTNLAEATW